MEDFLLRGSYELTVSVLVGASAFLAAWTAGTLLTPLMKKLSWRWGAVDRPDGRLKCHQRPTATLGGIPLALSTLLGLAILLGISHGFPRGMIQAFTIDVSWGGLLVAGFIIVAQGVTDDWRQIKPRTKLVFQLLASSVLIGSGLLIHHIDFFGMFQLKLSGLAVPFTLFWLIGSCNAMNFIDGLDGLASGIGLIISLTLAGIGLATGHYGASIIALTLAGGLLAILLFNLKPAQIFLGDGGSQLIGLMLGALSIHILTNPGGHFLLPAAAALMSIPVIDVMLSIVRRYGQDQSPACGDRRHMHHCLQRIGLGGYGTMFTLWTLVALSAAMCVACVSARGSQAVLWCLSFAAMEFYLGVRIGCVDLQAISRRLSQPFRFGQSVGTGERMRREAEVVLLWETMKPLFEQMKLERAILTLEAMGADGRPMYETYQWESDQRDAARFVVNRWTRRFALGENEKRMATLRLEAAEKMRRDEKHINWLLNQLRHNMEQARLRQTGTTAARESQNENETPVSAAG